MEDNVHFSSNNDEWGTPQWLFTYLDKIYHFTLDVAASRENHKCKEYYTKYNDGLSKSWDRHRVFLNPPYSNAGEWMRKAYIETIGNCPIVVMIIPARTDTIYWHKYAVNSQIWFLKGRVSFIDFSNPKNKSNRPPKTNPAPFPSAILIFGKDIKLGVKFVELKENHAKWRELDFLLEPKT